MTQETTEQKGQGEGKKSMLKVTVSFPISPEKPFKSDEEREATVAKVKAEAMTYFGVAEDGQHAYYLTHSGAKVADEVKLGDIAETAEAIKFTLVKELVQGSG